MIIRVIHAKVRPGRQSDFKKTLEMLVLPEAQRRTGMIAFYPGQPLGPNSEEFILVTVWKDQAALDSVRGSWTKAVIPQEAMPLLADWHVEGYKSFGVHDQDTKPLFQNI